MSLPSKGYKRSWKNLLINKSYQLKFTLFMVGLSTVLMVGLGVWVMKVANETTAVSIASVRGTPCEALPDLRIEAPTDEPRAVPVTPMDLDGPSAPLDSGSGSAGTVAPNGGSADAARAVDAGADAGSATEAAERPRIVMTESTMELVPEVIPQIVIPPKFGESFAHRWACELGIAVDIEDLEAGRLRILYVMIATGLLLVLGLAAYGIKMTHRVAGPLFKVGLYLAKMRDGRFDKVWNLRKGDQLVDFYDHFKLAHAGIVQMQTADLATLKAVIAAAEAAGAADDVNVQKLRDLVAQKEKSLE